MIKKREPKPLQERLVFWSTNSSPFQFDQQPESWQMDLEYHAKKGWGWWWTHYGVGRLVTKWRTRVATFVVTPTTFTLCSATSNGPPFTATGRGCNKLKSKAPADDSWPKKACKKERVVRCDWWTPSPWGFFLMVLVKVQAVDTEWISRKKEFSQKTNSVLTLCFSVCVPFYFNPAPPLPSFN